MKQKRLILAIAAALSSSSALVHAQVDLDADPAKPSVWASELKRDDSAPALPSAGVIAAALSVSTKVGFGFADGEKRYIRLDLSNNAKFKISTGQELACKTSITGASCLPRAVGGHNTSFAVFTLAASGAAANPTDLVSFSFSAAGGDGISTASNTPVSITYSLHNSDYSAESALTSPSSAALVKKTAEYIRFAPAINATVSADDSGVYPTAEVADGFTKFDDGTLRGKIGELTLGLSDQIDTYGAEYPLIVDSTTATPLNKSKLVADVLTSATLTVQGDFTATRDFSGSNLLDTYTTAKNRVYIGADDTCSSKSVLANAVTATEATFTLPLTGIGGNAICLEGNGLAPINASVYSASISFVPKTGYVVEGKSFDAVGEIKQNGVVLDTPYITLNAGYLSRVMFSNTSSKPVKYTAIVVTDSGATATLGAGATGEIPANANLQVNVSDLVAFSGKPRGAVRFTIASSNQAVQAVYQTVNLRSGDPQSFLLNRRGGGDGKI